MGRKSKRLAAEKRLEPGYYERHSREEIEAIINTMRERGKGFQETSSAIRRAYPFGERAGRPYKIWNRLVLEYEANLRPPEAAS